ncbi:MAG: cupin domain-containing protein [Proteobacteria bacterium]|nr:cupin domain-containing protein [Pseudomonadota bacterium]MDA0994437.1 cupin domain-containing protein [Pseudomonadota bacterium]
MADRYTVKKALTLVAESEDNAYGVLLEHGTLELGYYKPDKIDPQQPHTRDEIYVIQSGSGFFVLDGDRHPFETGEALFVPAGMVHRFEDFTDDFAAWVVFYGPDGGE